jgi:hypothetical protein
MATLAAADIPPMSIEEIEAEVKAYRNERRAGSTWDAITVRRERRDREATA